MSRRRRQNSKYDGSVYRSMALIMQFGINMLVPIGMMCALGIWLDGRFHTSFWTVVLFFAGAVAGGQNVYRMAKSVYAPAESSDRISEKLSEESAEKPAEKFSDLKGNGLEGNGLKGSGSAESNWRSDVNDSYEDDSYEDDSYEDDSREIVSHGNGLRESDPESADPGEADL